MIELAHVLPGGTDSELIIVGDPVEVEKAVRGLGAELEDSGATFTVQNVADLAAGASALASVAANSGMVLRLTDESVALVKKYGQISDSAGAFHTFVRDGSKIKAQLRFTSSSVKPQQLASLQAAAATMALRTAVQGVQDAVVRVEGKVDEILRLAKADRVGDILGQRATLSNLLGGAEDGPLSDADWASIAGLLTPIQSSIEALRRHVLLSVEALPVDEGPGERRSALSKLISRGMLGESLALLQVAESSMFMWQELRLHRVRHEEPEHLDGTLRSAHALLEANRQADSALLRHLATALEDYAHIDAFETPWKVHAKALAEDVGWAQAEMMTFAAARGIEEQAIRTQANAGLADTAREALELTAATGRTILGQGRRTGQILGSKAAGVRSSVREAVRDRTERQTMPRLFDRGEKDG